MSSNVFSTSGDHILQASLLIPDGTPAMESNYHILLVIVLDAFSVQFSDQSRNRGWLLPPSLNVHLEAFMGFKLLSYKYSIRNL